MKRTTKTRVAPGKRLDLTIALILASNVKGRPIYKSDFKKLGKDVQEYYLHQARSVMDAYEKEKQNDPQI